MRGVPTRTRHVLQLTNERQNTILFWVYPTARECHRRQAYEMRGAGRDPECPGGGGHTTERGWVALVVGETEREQLDEAEADSLDDERDEFADAITWG